MWPYAIAGIENKLPNEGMKGLCHCKVYSSVSGKDFTRKLKVCCFIRHHCVSSISIMSCQLSCLHRSACLSSISLRCLIWLRAGEFKGTVSTLNYLSFSSYHSWKMYCPYYNYSDLYSRLTVHMLPNISCPWQMQLQHGNQCYSLQLLEVYML